MRDPNDKRQTIFIHIGMNKTGTSAIQSVLNENRRKLKSFGLLYPRTGCTGDAHYGLTRTLGFHHGNASDRVGVSTPVKLREGFQDELRGSRCDTIVFSSENFVLPKPVETVRDFFSDFECRIVVYLRRHDYWWSAAYNQAVRMVVDPPWGRGVEAFARFHRRKNPLYGNYRHLVDRWAAVFGSNNVIVRPYEAQQNKPGLVADFLTAIGRRDLIDLVGGEVPRINESLGLHQIFLVDIMQRSKIPGEVRREIIDYIRTQIDSGTPSEEELSPELRMQLVAENIDDYQYIAKHYMNRRDGRLFFDPDPAPVSAWSPAPSPRFTEVVELVVAAVLGSRKTSVGSHASVDCESASREESSR